MQNMFTSFDNIAIAGATSDLALPIGNAMLADRLAGVGQMGYINPENVTIPHGGIAQNRESIQL